MGSWAGFLLVLATFAQDMTGPVKRVKVNGTELAYVEQGRGPAIVLVLGGVGDYRAWTNQIAAFSTRHRVTAYSFRYHYPNPPAGAGAEYTVPLHAADLAALIRALNLAPAHLVGYSYGGNVAAFVARDHPELVQTLVLADPPLYSMLARHPEARTLLAERGTALSGVQDALEAGTEDVAIRRFLDFVFAPGGFDSLAAPDRAVMLANASILRLLFRGAPAPFTCEDAGRVKAPTLLVTGERTLRLFTVTLDELQACLPKAERVTLRGTTHALPLENPAAFNEAVLRFLGKQ
jgi:pimeloyl-ACP methyl ester carboxylesterase